MSKRSSGFGWFLGLVAVMAVAAIVTTLLRPAPAGPDAGLDPVALAEARVATGGAQTLQDILARQEGLKFDDSFRDAAVGDDPAAALTAQLGTRGGESDSELWRALRHGYDDVKVSNRNPTARVLIQDGGMTWLTIRRDVIAPYGGWLLVGTMAALVAFYAFRGRIRVDGEMTGRTVTRFKAFERFSHWMLAGSFILLGISGLLTLFGRWFLIPLFGHEANAVVLEVGKFLHNNLAWPFMLALISVFVLWVWHNIPDRTDITWFKQFGGIIGNNHPPAKKFNGGQKIIFWSVIVLGTSISVSGLSLLFPFDLPLFAHTFDILNGLGVPGMLGFDPLPADMPPHMEMQLAQAWHVIVAFVLMAIIIAHIYIGSVGMEGAYDAMGSGEVDEAWAHQHHSIWLDEVKARDSKGHPAE